MVGRVAPDSTIQPNEQEARLRFGGGVNSRASSDEIDPRECAKGSYNFDLDLGNTQWRVRKPVNLAGTAPNAARINGFAQLIASDSQVTTLVQAGGIVYQVTAWDTWTQVGTCSTSARLRGPRHHIWNLDDVVLISDLAGVEEVQQWDGTTYEPLYHNLTGPFIAKYIFVDNERAFFGNVSSNGTATPHVVVCSALSDYLTLSTDSRPTSAATASDAWFLPTPDLKPINGMTGAFGLLVFSTLNGQMHQLLGADKTDFELTTLFYDSYADGDESITNIGNDIVFGRPGRIESLAGTDAYGDVELNDMSIKVSDQIASYTDWTIVYSSRHQRVYCSPNTQAELWVFHKPLAATNLSPWMKWQTVSDFAMQPTTMWSMLDPDDGLEYPYMGDESGNVYRLEGSGSAGDAGSDDITAVRVSKLESAPALAQANQTRGVVKFRPQVGQTSTISITMYWQGNSVYDTTITFDLAGAETGATYSGTSYYNDGTAIYGNNFAGRLAREAFGIAGQANEFQIALQITGKTNFEINEIFIGFSNNG